MLNRETSLAIFYNFKEEQTCKFCRMVKDVYDKGGTELVFDRLGLNVDDHKHNFMLCFIRQYWLTIIYDDQRKPRPTKIIVNEAIDLFNGLKKLLAVQ